MEKKLNGPILIIKNEKKLTNFTQTHKKYPNQQLYKNFVPKQTEYICTPKNT